jgi:TrmH family RNA methyltransferase
MKAATRILSSSANPLLKDVRRAASRGILTSEGFAVAEGLHLYDEAVASGIEIGAVLVSEELEGGDGDWPPDVPVYHLPRALFREIATTESPQGIVTLVRLRESGLAAIFEPGGPTLLLDGLQDPGNAGAIVRAAEAFGSSGVVFLKSTVSPFNPKCLRAAAGSLFRMPFINHPESEPVRQAISARGVSLYAAMPDASLSIEAVDWSKPSAIVIGSEGRGVSPDWSAAAMHIRIPTTGVESLNAAVAAAVILYEARRRNA